MQKSILIIDDERDMLQLLKRSLEPEMNAGSKLPNPGKKAFKSLRRSHSIWCWPTLKCPK